MLADETECDRSAKTGTAATWSPRRLRLESRRSTKIENGRRRDRRTPGLAGGRAAGGLCVRACVVDGGRGCDDLNAVSFTLVSFDERLR